MVEQIEDIRIESTLEEPFPKWFYRELMFYCLDGGSVDRSTDPPQFDSKSAWDTHRETTPNMEQNSHNQLKESFANCGRLAHYHADFDEPSLRVREVDPET